MINFNEFSDAIIGMLNRREEHIQYDSSNLIGKNSPDDNFAYSLIASPASIEPENLQLIVSAETAPTIKVEAAKTEIAAPEFAPAADKPTITQIKPAAIEASSAIIENESANTTVSFTYTPSQDTLRYLYSFMWNNDFLENFAPDTDYMQPVTEMAREELKSNAKLSDSFRELE